MPELSKPPYVAGTASINALAQSLQNVAAFAAVSRYFATSSYLYDANGSPYRTCPTPSFLHSVVYSSRESKRKVLPVRLRILAMFKATVSASLFWKTLDQGYFGEIAEGVILDSF